MSDVPGGERNATGIMIAGLSVVSSGMQQIFCRTMQQKHGLASHELLANTAPAQARPPLPINASRVTRAHSYCIRRSIKQQALCIRTPPVSPRCTRCMSPVHTACSASPRVTAPSAWCHA